MFPFNSLRREMGAYLERHLTLESSSNAKVDEGRQELQMMMLHSLQHHRSQCICSEHSCSISHPLQVYAWWSTAAQRRCSSECPLQHCGAPEGGSGFGSGASCSTVPSFICFSVLQPPAARCVVLSSWSSSGRRNFFQFHFTLLQFFVDDKILVLSWTSTDAPRVNRSFTSSRRCCSHNQ